MGKREELSKLLATAVEADQRGDLQEALNLYKEGCKALLQAIKGEQ